MRFDPSIPIAVFLGPSLRQEDARRILPANYYPPVRMGDVYRLTTCGVRLIVIIDGVFHNTAPVWQREIVAALDNGITVVGSSSMGALRAVELESRGMIGLGTIVDWYRSGRIEGDDEVALLHADGEYGYRPLSEPLVNVRASLEAAREAGVITVAQAGALESTMAALDHTRRDHRRLLQSAACAALPSSTQTALRSFLAEAGADLKRSDAVAALSWCAERLPRLLDGRVHPPYEGRAIERVDEQLLRGVPSGNGELPLLRELLVRAAEDRARVQAAVHHASRRFYLLDWMHGAGIQPPAHIADRYEQRWIDDCEVADRSTWLAGNAITEPELVRELFARAAEHWLLERGPGAFGLDRPFLEAWARDHGIEPPSHIAAGGECRTWLVEKGPNYFGFDQWSADIAFARELQLSGEIARLAAGAEARPSTCGAERTDAGDGAL
jgi:hypothetical protein